MKMFNPPHPGRFIKEVYLDELNITEKELSQKLKVSHSTINRLINGKINLTPEMALRLSKTLGRSPESWLLMQDKYSLWNISTKVNLDDVEVLKIPA